MGMTIDFSDFEQKFNKIVEDAIPSEAAKGLFKAGGQLLLDGIQKAPQAPKDIGDLWGSRLVNEAKVEKGKISLECGFNIKYAARWHEISPDNMSMTDKLGRPLSKHWPIHWTTTKGAAQPGPKYLETKMMMYKNDYMQIVADHIKNSAK